MTADDNFNQRVQIAQDRLVETAQQQFEQLKQQLQFVSQQQSIRDFTVGVDMELEGLVMESERDRLQRYSDCVIFWCKSSRTPMFTLTDFSNDRRK